MNKFQLLYDAQLKEKKARSRQPAQALKKKNFSKLARMSLSIHDLNGKLSHRKSIDSSQLSTAQISDRNKRGNIESSVLKIQKQKVRPISLEKLHFDHYSRKETKVIPSYRQQKYSQKLFFASELVDGKKIAPYRSSQTQMSNRSGKTPKADQNLFSTQRTAIKHSNFLSPPGAQDSHQRSLIQSKISKMFHKNKSVDVIPKRRHIKSTGSLGRHMKSTGSVGSSHSYASKVSKMKLTTVPTTNAISKKLQQNKSQLMVPQKSAKTTRNQIFNQTFGLETKPEVKKISLKPKAVKVQKGPEINSYQEIPHCEEYNDEVKNQNMKQLNRKKLVQTATDLIKLNQDQLFLKATPKIMKKQPSKKKFTKQNKENCLFKLCGERFSNEGLKKRKSILSPKPFTPISNHSTKSNIRTMATSRTSMVRPIQSRNTATRQHNLFLRNPLATIDSHNCSAMTLGQPPSKNTVEQTCQSPQDITGVSSSNSWSQLPSMSTDSKKVNVPGQMMTVRTMLQVSDQIKVVQMIKRISSPHESLTGIQAAPSVMEYDKTQKSAIQNTQEPTQEPIDELAAQPYDLETNFTPAEKQNQSEEKELEVRELEIISMQEEEPKVSRANIINIDLGVGSDKTPSEISSSRHNISHPDIDLKPEIMDFVDKSRQQLFQETLNNIKIQTSSEQVTTMEKSGLQMEICLDQNLLDISEGMQKELEKSQELLQVGHDSFINGTFRLDNTHSLEKFKELEKLCEGDNASRNIPLSMINSEKSNHIISVDNIDGPTVKFEPTEDPLRSPSLQADHFNQTLNTMTNLHLLEPFRDAYKSIPQVELPEPSQQVVDSWVGTNPKVIFIDIDETMIHCIDDRDPQTMKGQVKLNIMLQEQSEYLEIDVNVRPGLRECLTALSQCYQLVSFTASDQLYADTILNFIDPKNEFFHTRLYRHHCVETEYGLIKDLRIINNRDIKDLLLVDNSALSFSLNVLNGVPILPFYDSKSDEELRHLTYYLMGLRESQSEDIRVKNDQAFGLMRLAPAIQAQSQAQIQVPQPQPEPIPEEVSENEQSQFVDQPINLLSLMNTNHIIEERSNEDGQSSSQVSPEPMNRYRQKIIITHGSSNQDSQTQDNISEGSKFESTSRQIRNSQNS